MALAVYDPKGDDNKIIRLLLPPGLMLRPGFRFSVDKNPAETGAFEICFPNGCFAQVNVKKATVDNMKKAEKATVVVKNQGNAEVTFYLPLNNFGKAFDGPPIVSDASLSTPITAVRGLEALSLSTQSGARSGRKSRHSP